jgi:hypothetical protein
MPRACSCQDASHKAWVAYGAVMVLVYPVGVLCMYAGLLFKNRASINRPVEEREKVEELAGLVFLFEPYQPKCV